MTYLVTNVTNDYDAANKQTFETEELAVAKAHEILENFPKNVINVSKLLNTYTATVTINTEEVKKAETEE